MSYDNNDAIFHVLTNDEGQHALWLDGLALPAGWQPVGFTGAKRACLAHVDEVWTDMRPLSLRLRRARALPPRSGVQTPVPQMSGSGTS
jgi:MbtH protein